MTWWEGALLGLVQGATEFLPVSSSGHLVMAQTLLGADPPGVGVEVVLHAATAGSVIVAYRRRLGALVAGWARRDAASLRTGGLLALASAPAAVAGVGFGGFFERLFEAEAVTGAALLFTGWVLWTTKGARARPGRRTGPGWGAAAAMGIAQAAAIVPGVSRSGATVATAMRAGVDPGEAAAFSFLMYLPVAGGAALLELPGLGAALQDGGVGAWPLAAGAATACVSGIAAIRLFRAVLARRTLHRFSAYLWTAGTAFLLYALLG